MLKIPFILICLHDRKSIALQRLSDLYVRQKLWKNIYTRVKTITCVRRCTQANKLTIVAITIDRYFTQARSRYRKSAFITQTDTNFSVDASARSQYNNGALFIYLDVEDETPPPPRCVLNSHQKFKQFNDHNESCTF